VEFSSLGLRWPEVRNVEDVEYAKHLFRLSNTQFKKALDYFVLDGFVTEHVQIKQAISKLYKYLTTLEAEPIRVFGMLERRRDLLEPLAAELSPKAYEGTLS